MLIRRRILLLSASLAVIIVGLGLVISQKPVNPNLRFVYAEDPTHPLANQKVQLLCYETEQGSKPIYFLQFQTDSQGKPVARIPNSCRYIAALHVLHQQPSSKPEHGPAYTVYATSWKAGAEELLDVTSRISQREKIVGIYREEPLVLFNVVASLAWATPPKDGYQANFWYALKEASNYLYDVTDGRMAFGPITIFEDGTNWHGADIRVSAANDLHPSANVGGIVPEPLTYSAVIPKTFSPGEIYLGRNWDKSAQPENDPNLKSWEMSDGYRTIIHEWAHYALFLFDEYKSPSGARTTCTQALSDPNMTISDLTGEEASIMYWHYIASELWDSDDDISNSQCEETIQWETYQLNDCDTLAQWFVIQGITNTTSGADLPPIKCASGEEIEAPLAIINDLFDQEPCILNSPTAFCSPYNDSMPTKVPSITHSQEVIFEDCNAEAYQVVNQLYTATSLPNSPFFQQITPQGQAIDELGDNSWQIALLGVSTRRDSVILQAERYITDEEFTSGIRSERCYSRTSAANDKVVSQTTLGINMDLAYTMNSKESQLTELVVHLTVPQNVTLPETLNVHVQLCHPDAAIACPQEADISWQQSGVWKPDLRPDYRATITPLPSDYHPNYFSDYLPRYGIIHVRVADKSNKLITELVRWYRVTGVGPGVNNAHTPAAFSEDDMVTLYPTDPLTVFEDMVGCEQVVIMPSANFDMLQRPLGQDKDGRAIQGILGWPVDIAVRLPNEDHQCAKTFGIERNVTNEAIALTFRYTPLSEKNELTIPQENLRILYFDPTVEGAEEKLSWTIIDPNKNVLRDSDHDAVRSEQFINEERHHFITIPYQKDGIYVVGWVRP